MQSKLRNLLDKIYELEGLVHLALKRDDASGDFMRLISNKGEEIGVLSSEIAAEKGADFKGTTSIRKEESGKMELQFPLHEYSIYEDSGKDDITPNSRCDSSNNFPDGSVLLSNDIDLEISEYSITEEDEVPDKNLSSSMERNPSERKRGKLVFSINDKFRFRKELFNNSDADFNNTLVLVASMDNYEEAEEYFLNEEGFDKNNRAVTDFLEVIKRYFR